MPSAIAVTESIGAFDGAHADESGAPLTGAIASLDVSAFKDAAELQLRIEGQTEGSADWTQLTIIAREPVDGVYTVTYSGDKLAKVGDEEITGESAKTGYARLRVSVIADIDGAETVVWSYSYAPKTYPQIAMTLTVPEMRAFDPQTDTIAHFSNVASETSGVTVGSVTMDGFNGEDGDYMVLGFGDVLAQAGDDAIVRYLNANGECYWTEPLNIGVMPEAEPAAVSTEVSVAESVAEVAVEAEAAVPEEVATVFEAEAADSGYGDMSLAEIDGSKVYFVEDNWFAGFDSDWGKGEPNPCIELADAQGCTVECEIRFAGNREQLAASGHEVDADYDACFHAEYFVIPSGCADGDYTVCFKYLSHSMGGDYDQPVSGVIRISGGNATLIPVNE